MSHLESSRIRSNQRHGRWRSIPMCRWTAWIGFERCVLAWQWKMGGHWSKMAPKMALLIWFLAFSTFRVLVQDGIEKNMQSHRANQNHQYAYALSWYTCIRTKIKKVCCLSNHPWPGFGDADLESISGGAESEFLQSSASECLRRSGEVCTWMWKDQVPQKITQDVSIAKQMFVVFLETFCSPSTASEASVLMFF